MLRFKLTTSPRIKSLNFIFGATLFFSIPAFSQIIKGDKVACYKSSIKEPTIFYGNPQDKFTLYDESKWQVSSMGAHEYIPTRYRDVLVCPSENVLIVDKRVLSVKRVDPS